MKRGTKVWRVTLAALFLTAPMLGPLAATAVAQDGNGTITGRVASDQSERPMPMATVQIVTPAGEIVAQGSTNHLGIFRLSPPPGTYTVRVQDGLGFAGTQATAVQVAAGESVQIDLTVTLEALRLPEIRQEVETASRTQGPSMIAAPVPVSLVPGNRIREQPAANPLDLLRSVPIDAAQMGLQTGTFVARGFNNIFSGAILFLVDYRLAGIASLRANLMHFVPSTAEDIDRIELVRGPASALYGPNTRDGVLHQMTRSPFEQHGTTVSLSAGERDLFQGTFATSFALGERFAVRASGDYLQATEWEHTDPEEAAERARVLPEDPSTRIGERDFQVRRFGIDLRGDWKIDERTLATFSTGRTVAGRGIELTGVGAAQVRDWEYGYYQARIRRDRLFAQAYLNTSDAGETYTLRNGLPVVDRSRLLSAQVQHGFDVGGRQRLTYGVDFFRTMPDTEGTIHGRHEADDEYNELGAFVQVETALHPRLSLTLAGRGDHHSVLEDPVFSPRAALLYRPSEAQAVRLTYNRAFSTPTAVNLFLDIDAGSFPDAGLAGMGYGLWAQGTGSRGFSFRTDDGSLTGMRSPFNPGGRDQLLPADPAVMWGLAVGVLQAQGAVDAQTAAFLAQLAPAGGEVGMAYLDILGFSTPRPLTDDISFDFSPVRESYTSTWEVGYRGLLAGSVLLSADLWHSKHSNFISAIRPVTPLLFLEGGSLGEHAAGPLVGHFMGRGMGLDDAQAAAIELLTAMGSLPLGVLSSDEVGTRQGRSDLLVTFRNFGNVSLTGIDLEARYDIGQGAYGGGTLSWVDRDHFRTEGEVISLNAPALKWSVYGGYRDLDRGWNGELRVRRLDAFPVLSAPYQATDCIEGDWLNPDPCVEAAMTVDLMAGYELPMIRSTSLQLGVTNLLDAKHRSFAGVPEIGRMAIARIKYSF
jgi:outer membrane receptor for ferrienterochelin and colicins